MKVKEIIQWFFGAKKTVQKQHGITGGTAWFESDDQDEADALATLAIKKAGFKRSDFFKPVRVDHLVVDGMPEEGVFDTAFCDRYKLAEDGKSWLMPAAQEEIDSTSAKVEQNASSAISTEEQGNGPEGLGYNVNGEPMADVIKKMDWPVV
ncbi:MAG: RecE family exodeoxyribonuclease, partial [Acinetobacter sp.]